MCYDAHLIIAGSCLKDTRFNVELLFVCRARSVYERALDIDHRNITVWLKYAEMEMR